MNTVIYYPHLYPPPEWLRLAALCWDEVYALHPPGAPAMPEDVMGLDQALGGVLKTVNIRDLLRDPDVDERFEAWLDDAAEELKRTPENAREWFGLLPPKMNMRLERLLYERGLAREGHVYETVRVPRWLKGEVEQSRTTEFIARPYRPNPRSKLLRKYQEILDQADRARAPQRRQALREEAERFKEKNMISARRPDNYIFIPKQLAFNYMSLLASKAAEDRRTDVATTSEEFAGILFHDIRRVRGRVATAVLEARLPRDLASLDPNQLGEFREELSTARLKYQATIQELVGQFEKVSSEDTLGRIERDIQEIANERIEEATTAYRKGKVDLVSRVLTLTLTPPAVAAWLASALGMGIIVPAGIAAALSLFAARELLDARKAQLERKRSGWTYIFDVRKMFRCTP